MTSRNNLNSDQLYYNFWIRNTDDYRAIPADFTEQRDDVILSQMENFTTSVVRFKIPGAIIPLFVFEDGEYEVSFATSIDGGVTFSNVLTEPVVYNPTIELDNDIYPYNRFVFYYWQFLEMVNTTLSTLWTQAILDPVYVPIIGAVIDEVFNAPYFELKESSAFLRLNLPLTALGGVSPFVGKIPPAPQIYIFMNPKLFYFFAGFNSKYFQGGAKTPLGVKQPTLSHMLQLLNVKADDQVTIPAFNTVPAHFVLVENQDYSSIHLWQKLSRLLLTTDMPIQSESIGVNDFNGRPFSQTLLTDFEIPPNEAGTAREYIYFYPQGDLRKYNFTANGVLRRMSVRVFYQLNDLSLIPLLIPPGFELTIKLEFQRRLATDLLAYGNQNLSVR